MTGSTTVTHPPPTTLDPTMISTFILTFALAVVLPGVTAFDCVPKKETKCQGKQIVKCNGSGRWKKPEDCPDGGECGDELCWLPRRTVERPLPPLKRGELENMAFEMVERGLGFELILDDEEHDSVCDLDELE